MNQDEIREISRAAADKLIKQVRESVANPITFNIIDGTRELIDELDFELMMLEDVLHGEEGRRITKARHLLTRIRQSGSVSLGV